MHLEFKYPPAWWHVGGAAWRAVLACMLVCLPPAAAAAAGHRSHCCCAIFSPVTDPCTPVVPPPPTCHPACQVVLGYRGTRGHRLWRRVKPLLAKRGHVEEFLARSAEDKAVK